MNATSLMLGVACLASIAVMQHCSHSHDSSEPVVHVRNEFEFTIHAPYKTAVPLFGANAERAWAGPEWDPHFLYPRSAEDVPGAVFTVEHGHHHRAAWINTAFDLEAGHVQYVYFLNGVIITLIDIHISPRDASSTTVKVAYERTALSPDANDHVHKLGESDRKSAPHWESDFENYFSKLKTEVY